MKQIILILCYMIFSTANAKLYTCPTAPITVSIGEKLWGGEVEYQGHSLSYIKKIYLSFFGESYYIKNWGGYGIGKSTLNNSILECCSTILSTDGKPKIVCIKRKVVNSDCEYNKIDKSENPKTMTFICKDNNE